MHLEDLDYQYPEELIATSPVENSRVMLNAGGGCSEIDLDRLIEEFDEGDLLVLNNSKVVKKRIFCGVGPGESQKVFEVLFLQEEEDNVWTVLFPASRLKKTQHLLLPGGITGELVERGRPQKLKVSEKLDLSYFEENGELPLPPYIQKARGDRHQQEEDDSWYQTAWAEVSGSAASPTASLHFKDQHIAELKAKGVNISYVTLHVGLGTFLPIDVDDLETHIMHKEWIEVSAKTLEDVLKTKKSGKRIWALGTTVTRSLESYAAGKLDQQANGNFIGDSDLFIYPPYEFKIVDVLLTNFHQPKTTLMALVSAFTNLENVKSAYQWAVENKFRLFSYGDLSVWMKR